MEELKDRFAATDTLTPPGDPSPRRRWAVPLVAAVAVAAAAWGATALLGGASGTDDAPPLRPAAFTVNANADGSVTFAANEVIDPAAATQALNNAGIAGRVINDVTPGCTTGANDIAPTDLYPDNTIGRGLGESGSVTLRTSDYPAGGGLLVVVTSRGEDTGRAGVAPDPVAVAIFAFDDAGKIPTCVDFADPGSS